MGGWLVSGSCSGVSIRAGQLKGIFCFYSHPLCVANLTLRWTPQCAEIMCSIGKTPSCTCLFLQLKISQKQNLRNGTLLWLSRTHSQTHLSGNRSSSNRAENHRKLQSKTNRAVMNALQSPEDPNSCHPTAALSSVKNWGLQNSTQPECLPLGQMGAVHSVPVFPHHSNESQD